MKIALDYDGTYTAHPEFWNRFIADALASGHQVVCMTMRFPHEAIQMPCEVIYTGRRAKVRFAAEHALGITIWVDDAPHWLMQDAA